MRSGDIGGEEGAREEDGGRGNENVTMDVRCHYVGQDQKREDQRKHESGRDFKEGPGTQDVMRRDEEYVGKRAMGIEVQGSRRGRPKRWADCVKDDLREKGLSGEEVYDRAAWKRLSSHIDPT